MQVNLRSRSVQLQKVTNYRRRKDQHILSHIPLHAQHIDHILHNHFASVYGMLCTLALLCRNSEGESSLALRAEK